MGRNSRKERRRRICLSCWVNQRLNLNPELLHPCFVILSNWRESKKEINDPERKDRFILLTNSLIHSPYLNSLFINKELGKASVSEFAYFTYSGLNELFFLCRNNQNNLGFLIWSYWFHSDGPIIIKFYPLPILSFISLGFHYSWTR